MLTLPRSEINGFSQLIHLLKTRSTPRSPMTADILFSCLERFKTILTEHDAFEVQFFYYRPQTPCMLSLGFYSCLMDVCNDTPLSMVLHDRTYVSIASMTYYPRSTLQNFYPIFFYTELYNFLFVFTMTI